MGLFAFIFNDTQTQELIEYHLEQGDDEKALELIWGQIGRILASATLTNAAVLHQRRRQNPGVDEHFIAAFIEGWKRGGRYGLSDAIDEVKRLRKEILNP